MTKDNRGDADDEVALKYLKPDFQRSNVSSAGDELDARLLDIEERTVHVFTCFVDHKIPDHLFSLHCLLFKLSV